MRKRGHRARCGRARGRQAVVAGRREPARSTAFAGVGSDGRPLGRDCPISCKSATHHGQSLAGPRAPCIRIASPGRRSKGPTRGRRDGPTTRPSRRARARRRGCSGHRGAVAGAARATPHSRTRYTRPPLPETVAIPGSPLRGTAPTARARSAADLPRFVVCRCQAPSPGTRHPSLGCRASPTPDP